jgi:hypothetical protein
LIATEISVTYVVTDHNSSGVTKLTGIAPQFLVDDLYAAIAYYRQRLGTPAALIHPVHLVGRNLTDRSIDVRIRAKGKDATARLP